MASQRLCPGGCGRRFTKGVTRHVLQPDGTIATQIVCKPCGFSRAIQIVIPQNLQACGECRTRKPVLCGVCSNEAAHKAVRVALKPWAEYLAKLAKAYPGAKGEGLRQAAEILAEGNAIVSRVPTEQPV